jgi:hypothetical protein
MLEGYIRNNPISVAEEEYYAQPLSYAEVPRLGEGLGYKGTTTYWEATSALPAVRSTSSRGLTQRGSSWKSQGPPKSRLQPFQRFQNQWGRESLPARPARQGYPREEFRSSQPFGSVPRYSYRRGPSVNRTVEVSRRHTISRGVQK